MLAILDFRLTFRLAWTWYILVLMSGSNPTITIKGPFYCENPPWKYGHFTLFIFYKNHVFSAQPGKGDKDNYRQLTMMFLNFELM